MARINPANSRSLALAGTHDPELIGIPGIGLMAAGAPRPPRSGVPAPHPTSINPPQSVVYPGDNRSRRIRHGWAPPSAR